MQTTLIILISFVTLMAVVLLFQTAFLIYKKIKIKQAKEKWQFDARNELSKKINELKAKNQRFLHQERNLLKKHETIQKQTHHKKIQAIIKRENEVQNFSNQLINQETKIKEEKQLLNSLKIEVENQRQLVIKQLEEISNITEKEAREQLFSNIEKKEKKSLGKLVREIKNKTETNLKEIITNILANSIERFVGDYIEDKLTYGIVLENQEIKGKIIGKEGRNIKAFEKASGTDLLIEKDSNLIKISSFNPIRREIAVQAMKSLIKDGRIQPQRIEETIKKETANIENTIHKKGKEIIDLLGIVNIENGLVYHIGKLKYRTSYGQNALQHCVEVAKIAGAMAKELDLNDEIAVRAGLLHDIGKSNDYEIGESHVETGIKLARKYNESNIVINAIHSHHGDIETNNVYSVLVGCADTISAARPGARDNVHEDFLQRMEKIEAICDSIDGIQKSYAIKSGRVIRIIVDPVKINDYEIRKIHEIITERVKKEIQIPGEIKIIVIRETRFESIIN